jgi:perosamine synthetase
MDYIRWYEPKFGNEELEEVKAVLKAEYVNEGPKTAELENDFKKYLGVKHIIMTTSATAALFLAIKAEATVRRIQDFEVIVPDLTMFATATAVNWAGGRPIMVDVKKDNLTIDPAKIARKINNKTIAIVPVHITGRSADMPRIMAIANEHNLAIIEDAAGALGSKLQDRFLGTIGKVGCFSLQSNKIITSGQGGVIASNDDKHYELIRRLRDFGRFSKEEFLHEITGYNLKFNDLSAALAIAQLRKLEERKLSLINQSNRYKLNLSTLQQIKFFDFAEGEIPLWIDVIVRERRELSDYLASKQIYCRNCWPALHRNKPYADRGSDSDFPNSSFASDKVLWLPNGPKITREKINHVCDQIKQFYSMR